MSYGKPFYRKILIVVIIIALVSITGYGVYHYTTRPPNVTFTTVNFKLNYKGNYSNYLEPVLLAPNGTAINNSLISSAYSSIGVYKNPGDTSWHTYFFLYLISNPNSPNNTLYQALKNYGYVFNDSAVIDSITSNTPGFSVSSVSGNPNMEVPFPVDPIYGVIKSIGLSVNSMYYHGPLNLTINASAPAHNLVFYKPKFSIEYSGNASSPYAETSPAFSGFQGYQQGYSLDFSQNSIYFSVWVVSTHNFTITSINVSTPFSFPLNSYTQPVRELNGGSYGYYDDLNFSINPPQGQFIGDLNVTVHIS